MVEDILDILRRLLAIIIVLIGAAYTIIYYMIAICILAAGASLSFVVLCTYRRLLQSIAEHMPLKQYFDRRLQKSFLSKVKDMEEQRNDMRARLVLLLEDVKMKNAANDGFLKEIRLNEAMIKRKIRGYEPSIVDRQQVHPTMPGFIVLDREPEPPSPYAFVRWLYAQDIELHGHGRAIARYEIQIPGEEIKIRQLDEEGARLQANLDDVNTLRCRVQPMDDLPKPRRMPTAHVNGSVGRYGVHDAQSSTSTGQHFVRQSELEYWHYVVYVLLFVCSLWALYLSSSFISLVLLLLVFLENRNLTRISSPHRRMKDYLPHIDVPPEFLDRILGRGWRASLLAHTFFAGVAGPAPPAAPPPPVGV